MAAATDGTYDVAILGGGLAGLTLGLQILGRRPGTRIVTLEKRQGPAPEAAFKVGESTVEPAAHYFGDIIGMKDHIEEEQLRKFGLRFFCPAAGNEDISRRVEIGPPFHMPVPSYQLDRGRFENELGRRNTAAGIDLLDNAFVQDVDLGGDEQTVTFVRGRGAEPEQVSARWIVDAAGRASILKRKLGLDKEVPHKINSVWFRLEGGLDLEDFSDDEEWLGRMEKKGLRRYSTNHLMGHGYWVWLIQLSSGPISIGICADPRYHAMETMDDLDKAIGWLKDHEPQVAAVAEERGRDKVEDFLKIENFSLGAEQVFSADRWCVTGEAGVFVDPLCSPGSDFIAYSNSLVTDIVVRELDGEDVTERAEVFNELYLRAFDSILKVYTDAYPLLGNAKVFVPKFITNAILYWGVWSLMFFKDKTWDLEFLKDVKDDLEHIHLIYDRSESLFREWHELDHGQEWSDIWVSPPTVQPLAERVRDLATPRNEQELRERFSENVKVYEALVVVMFDHAARLLPDAPSWEGKTINPYAVSLQPDRWEADGLFDGTGMTVDEARERLPGIENVWMEERVAVS
jgi:flavin-dependent dehydrogenase